MHFVRRLANDQHVIQFVAAHSTDVVVVDELTGVAL